jgi:iron complex transport system permease protein
MSLRLRLVVVSGVFGLLAIAAVVWAPTVGSTPISIAKAFDSRVPWADNVDAQIFFVARLPRALAGAVIGGTLAAAGVVLQALLRNPLATPFTLGVSAGAALGAMLAIAWRLDVGALGVSSVPVASFLGSLVAMLIVYALASSQRRGLSTNVLLLAGVTLNSFFSALILFVQYLSDFAESYRAVRWLMGDLDIGSYGPILAAMPFTAIAFAVFATLPRALNLLTMGEDVAASRGVDVVHAQRWAFFSASLATGAAVSLGGPVGFIGIVVPHLVRLMVGSDNRVVLPAATLFGAAFLVMCDLLARTVMAPVEVPVGIITALIGGPFFLWLLVRQS